MIKQQHLPYEGSLLSPIISSETVDFHYNKHHKGYVDKLNGLISGTELEDKNLEYIIKSAYQEQNLPIFNNAAQIWNHDFYWKSITGHQNHPSGKLAALIEKNFASVEDFINKLVDKGATLFGSGWVWLVQNEEDLSLSILQTSNADLPLVKNKTPLFTIDVWEHAYYIDYRNNRVKYLNEIVKLINWEFVSDNARF